jgi:hypothetical protein
MKASFFFLLLVLRVTVGAVADESPADPPYITHLPIPFSKFSPDDVLAQVFPSYDRKISRQSEFYNQENQPALVVILEARPWTLPGKKYLAVFIEVGADDGSIQTLCGACITYGFTAVLRENHGKIALVARQETGTYVQAKNTEAHRVDGPPDALWFTGHDHVSLDLAPYKLTREERLLGVRMEHMWLPAGMWDTDLLLFRIVGRTLKPVFRRPVIERHYQNLAAGPLEKTTAVLSSVPAGRFYDLRIDRTTLHCPGSDDDDADFDCTLRHRGAKRIGRRQERWSFNGEVFAITSARKDVAHR